MSIERGRVKSDYLHAKFGHGIDLGFTSVPNLLMKHGRDIGLSDHAMYFIIQTLWLMDQKKTMITDADYTMASSDKTKQRIRKELQSLKGKTGETLVSVRSYYERDASGRVVGVGTMYDFVDLINYLLCEYAPTRQNVFSETKPTGQIVSTEDQKGQPAGQIVPLREDKMTDTNKEIEEKKYRSGDWFKFKLTSVLGIDVCDNDAALRYLHAAAKEIDGNVIDIWFSNGIIYIKGNLFAEISRVNIVRFLYEIKKKNVNIEFEVVE